MDQPRFADVIARLYPDADLLNAQRLTGGVSADVFRLDLEFTDRPAASVVLRMHGDSHSGHPAELEYQFLQALHRGGLPVAEPLAVDANCTLLPHPFLMLSYVEGTTDIPAGEEDRYIAKMANLLSQIHDTSTAGLPDLPLRTDPLPEVFEYLPTGTEWKALHRQLSSLKETAYRGAPRLLHGDFWPENLLWHEGEIAAVLDWEDAALGDPMADVAGACVELRYRLGPTAMQRFTEAYAQHHVVDSGRLALWQVYVAAAAQHYMDTWGLPSAQEAHMRREALACVAEAGAELV
jgi:aminoglycoside phosphotransferase (APT) family kinase protein